MPIIREKKILPYSSQEIFQLVIHVEDYPSFLPWAKSARVYNKTESGFDADLTIGYKMFEETYASKVEFTNESDNHFQVKTVATHGPFEHLTNCWVISLTKPKQCEVDFLLNFEFKSSWFSGLLTPVFHQATQKMMEAFEKRACEKFR